MARIFGCDPYPVDRIILDSLNKEYLEPRSSIQTRLPQGQVRKGRGRDNRTINYDRDFGSII